MSLTPEDRSRLLDLEATLWRAETLFDRRHMQRILASDFFEIGRSGHIYFRQDVLAMERREIKAELSELEIRRLDEHTLLVTYLSTEEFDGRTENSRRSSIWSQTSDGWQLRFHQGTPYRP